MNPGDLNDRIDLYHRITADPATGETYRRFATVWCQFEPLNGREFSEGSERIGQRLGRFTALYRTDVDLTDRLVFAGKSWDITAVDRVGFNEAMVISAFTIGDAP
jgi:head-tail adaptor